MGHAWRARLPGFVRPPLRRVRDVLQVVDAAVRRRLPVRLGGRLTRDRVHVRALAEGDRDAVARLRPAAQAHRIRFDEPTRFLMGILVADELVAMVHCVGLEPAARNGPFARALFVASYVDPRFRRRGLAQRLYRGLLEQLGTVGGRRAYAWVGGQNRASKAAFLAAGFRPASPCERAEALATGLSPVEPGSQLLVCPIGAEAEPAPPDPPD